MRWAKRLKRVFAIDIERCRRCGSATMAAVIDPTDAPATMSGSRPTPISSSTVA
jgi:hypothetical protein